MKSIKAILLLFLPCIIFETSHSEYRNVEVHTIEVNNEVVEFEEDELIIIKTTDRIEFSYHIEQLESRKEPFLFKVDLKSDEYNHSMQPKNVTNKWFKNLPEADYILIVSGISPTHDWSTVPDTVFFRVNNFEAGLLEKISELKEELALVEEPVYEEEGYDNYIFGASGLLIGIIFAFLLSSILFNRKNKASKPEAKKMDKKDVNQVDNADLAKENANLKSEIAALRGQIDALQMRGDGLRKQNKELLQKIDKLSKSKNEIEDLQTQKDELFALVIHDIKNPVALIKNLVELLRSYDLTANEQHEIIDDIFTTTTKIVSLSQEVSKILSLESNTLTVNPETCDMNMIVSDVMHRYEKAAKEKDIMLYFKENGSLPECDIDPIKIDDVLDNLVSNAIKFTQSGGKVKVIIKHNADNIEVDISDNGQGLDEKDIQLAFKRGAMLSARPTGDEHSSGLGLWIVKRLIEVHNGRVWIKSAVGKGSTFSFSVPITYVKEEG